MKQLAILSCLLASASARAEAPRQVSFKEAIDLSLGKHPDVLLAAESVAGADERVAATAARRYPGLHVNTRANLYTEAYELPFGDQVFTLHQRETTTTSVTISQPLTGLAYLSELVGAARHDAKVSRGEYERTRLETAYRTAEAYIRVLKDRVGATVAHRLVTSLQSELDRAILFRQADTNTDVDVLRFRSAKAAADQTALRADSSATSDLAALVVQLGLHDGTSIDIIDDLPATPPPLTITLDQALERAIAARPELRTARERIAAADAAKRSARAAYFPDIRAVATWDHTTGVQPFAEANAEFVGLTLSWNVWDWGTTHHNVLEAGHAKSRANIQAEALIDHVRLEVRQRWLEAKTAFDSIAVTETQLKASEEANRLQKVRFDNAAATTTDVLDSESEVSRARLAFALARYDYYLALVALARSIGDLPTQRIQ